VIRAVLGTSGRPPLQAPGLEIHGKLARLDEAVGSALKRHGTPLAGQLARHLHRAVAGTHRLAEMTTRLHRFVKRSARVLGQEGKTSAEVTTDFDVLLERVRARLGRPGVAPEEARALRKMLSSSEYYGDKLFTCYDHPDIPPTNNGHEHAYGRARGYERRVTGHKSTSRTVRDGRFVAPAIERTLRRGVASPEELARVSPEVYKGRLEDMRKARERHARARLIRERYDAVVEELASRGDRRRRRRRAGALDKAILRC
jgi:hypothetical protein